MGGNPGRHTECKEPVIIEVNGNTFEFHLPFQLKLSPKMARWLREQLRKADEDGTPKWITIEDNRY